MKPLKGRAFKDFLYQIQFKRSVGIGKTARSSERNETERFLVQGLFFRSQPNSWKISYSNLT